MIKLTDIVKDMGLELGKVYTDRDLPAFKTPEQIEEEKLVEGGIVSGGSDKARDIISKMTNGYNINVGNLSNMSNWLGQYKDGLEFGLKK